MRPATFTGNLQLVSTLHVVVMAANDGEKNNRQGNEQQRDPGALHEFCHQHHDGGDTGNQRAEPLTSALFNQFGPRFFHQCTTMPDCESVKARKAPTA